MADADPLRGFDCAVATLDYPMLIATVASDSERAGCLVGFATQSSVRPRRFLICLSVRNRTFRLARSSGSLVVHALAREQDELAELFGGATGDEVDKFARCAWRPGWIREWRRGFKMRRQPGSN